MGSLIFSPALRVSCSGLISPPLPSMNPPPGAGRPARLPGGRGRILCSGTRPPPPPPPPATAVCGDDGDSEEGGVDPELSLPEPGRFSLLNALEVFAEVVG